MVVKQLFSTTYLLFAFYFCCPLKSITSIDEHHRPLSDYETLDKCLVLPNSVSLHSSHTACAEKDEVCYLQKANDCEICQGFLEKVQNIYSTEKSVHVSSLGNFTEEWIHKSLGPSLPTACMIAVIPKPKLDRSCLMTTPLQRASNVVKINITRSTTLVEVVRLINDACNTYRDTDGKMNMKGNHKAYILDNLFSVKSLNDSRTSSEIFRERQNENDVSLEMPRCERVHIKSWYQFFTDYLQYSKPVVIVDATREWLAFTKWSNHHLRLKYGNESVHVKMSPTHDYEGIENADLWDGFKEFKIPDIVLRKLKYPDLVVPRPAPVNMKFSDFIDMMELIANKTLNNVSAYLEYSSLNAFPEMLRDIQEMGFLEGKLMLRHLNIWLSDGNTLGKLHFDPFDNFLCMIDGIKELILFEPHQNEELYEAHIPEAEFSVDLKSLKFKRRKLKDSTSMVMSPIDIKKPNYERFPLFKNSRPLNCTIGEGDVLFLPAFWWHEVQSYPNKARRRNLAVNYWYEPFLTKDFPCPSCRLDVNFLYNHLL